MNMQIQLSGSVSNGWNILSPVEKAQRHLVEVAKTKAGDELVRAEDGIYHGLAAELAKTKAGEPGFEVIFDFLLEVAQVGDIRPGVKRHVIDAVSYSPRHTLGFEIIWNEGQRFKRMLSEPMEAREISPEEKVRRARERAAREAHVKTLRQNRVNAQPARGNTGSKDAPNSNKKKKGAK